MILPLIASGATGTPVAVARFGDLRLPDEAAGARVERNQVRVRRADVDLVAHHRHAAVRSFAQGGLMMISQISLPVRPSSA